MKTSEEMAQSVMQRARVHRAAAKRKIITVTAAFLCVCGIGLAALTAGITPDPVPDTLQAQPTTEATEAIIKTASTKIALMNCADGGTQTTEMEKDVKLPYQMEIRRYDIRGLTEDEVTALRRAEDKYARDLIAQYPDESAAWSWNHWTDHGALFNVISVGGIVVQLDDPKQVESFHVSLAGDGQLFYLPGASDDYDLREYHLNDDEIERYYHESYGGIRMSWTLNSGRRYDLHTPLSSFEDTITVTVTFHDGTVETHVIDIVIDDSGKIYTVYRGETVTA